MRKITSMLLACMILGAAVGCNGNVAEPGRNDGSGSESRVTEETSGSDDKTEEEITYMSIIKDKTFRSGFDISYMSDTPEIAFLDYGGKASGERRWVINEEGSKDPISALTPVTTENGFYAMKSPNGSKVLKVDTETGRVYMELNAAVDYGDVPRVAGQGWPHLLICQNYGENETPYLDEISQLRMQMDFDFVKFENVMGEKADRSLHACQFQWYVTVQNVNPDSPDFGDFFWFGLQFFDNRFTFCGQDLKVDGGKDTATGKAIYTVDMKKVMKMKPVEEGESYSVDYDILPDIVKALEKVKAMEEIECFKQTKLGDLRIGHTNIGWEMPGTYNGAVMIDSFDIRYAKR